jgi:hypothetical protein
VGGDSSLPFADPLHERQEPSLKRQVQDVARWPPDRRRGALPKRFFLLSCPDSVPGPGICALQVAAARGVKPHSNTCGIFRGLGCGTLRLYNRFDCSNYVSDLWS